MAVWDELKVFLARLRDQQPGTLMQYPMPEVDEGRQPPFTIRLAPWAAATADELHQQFGNDIELTVGGVPFFPPPPPPHPPPAPPPPRPPPPGAPSRAPPPAPPPPPPPAPAAAGPARSPR